MGRRPAKIAGQLITKITKPTAIAELSKPAMMARFFVIRATALRECARAGHRAAENVLNACGICMVKRVCGLRDLRN